MSPCRAAQVYQVQFNSADLDGNGVANLTDIAAFTQILFGAYDYSADFLWDGVINLSDGCSWLRATALFARSQLSGLGSAALCGAGAKIVSVLV